MKLSTLPVILAAISVAASPINSSACLPAPPNPDSPVSLTVTTDRPLLQRDSGLQELIVRIDVRGVSNEQKLERQPLNLSVVLDRSGSMRGAKLEQARQAAEMLVDRLGPDDYFSVVTYDTEVDVLIPPQQLRGNLESLKRKIRRIEAGGSTALYHGVETGGRQLAEFFGKEKINRVLLLSDGIANVGPSSNRDIAHLGQELAQDGLSVTTIGVGDDYNEDLMTALAEASDANYYYVADVEGLPEVFEKELGELENVVARRLVLEITFPEGIEPMGFLGRREALENRRGRIDFGTLAAEQTREIFVTCRVDPKLALDAAIPIAQAQLTYATADDTLVNLSGEASVKTVDDAKLVEKSQVAEIIAQAEIYRNAAATERAIELADAGKAEEAKQSFSSQISRLRSAQIAAPAAQADALKREIEVLEESQSQLGAEGLSKEARKTLQWNAYQRRNSKEIAPVEKSSTGTR